MYFSEIYEANPILTLVDSEIVSQVTSGSDQTVNIIRDDEANCSPPLISDGFLKTTKVKAVSFQEFFNN